MAKFADELRAANAAHIQNSYNNAPNDRAASKAETILLSIRQQCSAAANRGGHSYNGSYDTFGWRGLTVLAPGSAEAKNDTIAVVSILNRELAAMGFSKYKVSYRKNGMGYSAGYTGYVVDVSVNW